MPVRIRCKFQCQEVTRKSWGSPEARTYRFAAIYDPDIPEDQRYSKATPSGTAELLVDNPSAKFELGKFYYLDFVPVEDQAAADDAS